MNGSLKHLLMQLAWACVMVTPLAAQQKVLTLSDPDSTILFGSVVTAVGDSSGDGLRDLLIGSKYSGKLSLYSGSDGAVLFSKSELGLGVNVGVGPVGDINGDRRHEFAILAKFGKLANLYSPGAQLPLLSLEFDPGTNCREVDTLGDLNGDGAAEFVVGCPTRFGTTQIDRGGAALIYSGRTGSLLRAIEGKPSEFFAYSVASAGDVNKDGFSDVLVAVIPGPKSGRVELYSGKDGTLLHTFSSPSGAQEYGTYVRALGDINKDGYPDIGIGAPLSSRDETQVSIADVFSGSDGSLLYRFAHHDPTAGFGVIGAAGDFNGDTYADIIVGAPAYDAYRGRVFIYSGKNGKPLATMVGSENGMLGSSVGTVGDPDRAGRDQIYASEPGLATADRAGRVFTYRYFCDGRAADYPYNVCGCGAPDVDDFDFDGTINCLDQCPRDAGKSVPGVCGCGKADSDKDRDGSFDCNDLCQDDPAKTAPGACGCGFADADTNGDGKVDCSRDCTEGPNCINNIKIQDITLAAPVVRQPNRRKKRVAIVLSDFANRPGNWNLIVTVKKGGSRYPQVKLTKLATVTMNLPRGRYKVSYIMRDDSGESPPSPTTKFTVR